MIFCKNCSKYNDKWYWKCCPKPSLAELFWVAGLLSLAGAWTTQGGIWWGWDGLTWYWNALVFGVLAVGLKISKYHDCWHLKESGCGCGCDKCAEGKCGTHSK